jgi:hypothetical protein
MSLKNGFTHKSNDYQSTSQATRNKRYKFCDDGNQWGWKLLQVIQRMLSAVVHSMSEEMIDLEMSKRSGIRLIA